MKTNNIQDTINAYIKHLENERYSHLTVDQYRRILTSSMEIMKVKNISNFSENKILKYRTLLQQDETSTQTKNLKIIILRSFIFWTNQNQLSAVFLDKVKTFRNSNRSQPLSLVTRDELQKFLSQTIDRECDLVVNMLYQTGLRLTELTNLKVKDISPEFQIVGKGKKTRTVFIPESLVTKIKEYADAKNRLPESHLFQLTHRTIQRKIKQRGEDMGLSQLMTPHKLRHLYATHLYENGADLRTLQEILGHSSINTTQIYTHVNTEKMRDTVNRCRPEYV